MTYGTIEPGSKMHLQLSGLADDAIEFFFHQAEAVGVEDQMRLLALLCHTCMGRLMDPDFDPDEVTH